MKWNMPWDWVTTPLTIVGRLVPRCVLVQWLQFRDADDPMNENFPTIDGMKLLYKAVRKGWVIDFDPTEDS